MTEPTETERPSPEERLRTAVQALATRRTRPCVALLGATFDRDLVRPLRASLERMGGEAIDVVLCSHGGDLDAAYLAARELRRRSASVTVYVPLCAKSAATLLCLAANELVLGDLGELGPLDPQRDERRAEDVPSRTSALLSMRGLLELNECALQLFGEATERLVTERELRPYDAAERAARFVGRTLAPLYGRLDLVRLAEHAGGVQHAREVAERVLRRFRFGLPGDLAERVAGKLVTGYASHGFVIDREELAEIGFPCRAPDGREAPLVDEMADALIECGEQVTVCGLFEPEPAGAADEPGAASATRGDAEQGPHAVAEGAAAMSCAA